MLSFLKGCKTASACRLTLDAMAVRLKQYVFVQLAWRYGHFRAARVELELRVE